MQPKLDFRDISMVYRQGKTELTVLSELNLQLDAGELVVLVGPSGCGKSTLLFVGSGLTEPTSGTVFQDGRPAGAPGANRGVVFQQFALFPWKTALQNIVFGLKVAGVSRGERNEIARKQLDRVGLSKFADAYPRQLSGGMQQRVAIARSLALEPEILFMDEPFAALDAQTRMLMQEHLATICGKGLTTLFVTHSVEEAVYLGDRIVVMKTQPGAIKEIVQPPIRFRDYPIETAMAMKEFVALREEVWQSVRAEIVGWEDVE